jgi:anti-sigma factor RsiW
MSHVSAELTALVDGALPAAEAEAVRAHLAGCAACRAEAARLRSAAALLGALPPPPPPSPAFAARLEARLEAERGRRRGVLARLLGERRRFVLPAAAAAAAALVAVITIRSDRARERDVAAELDLLENYTVVASLGDVETAEDAEVVAHLDELAAGRDLR